MKTLSMGELAQLIKYLRGSQNFMPALIASTCGLRASEILALRCGPDGANVVTRILSSMQDTSLPTTYLCLVSGDSSETGRTSLGPLHAVLM